VCVRGDSVNTEDSTLLVSQSELNVVEVAGEPGAVAVFCGHSTNWSAKDQRKGIYSQRTAGRRAESGVEGRPGGAGGGVRARRASAVGTTAAAVVAVAGREATGGGLSVSVVSRAV